MIDRSWCACLCSLSIIRRWSILNEDALKKQRVKCQVLHDTATQEGNKGNHTPIKILVSLILQVFENGIVSINEMPRGVLKLLLKLAPILCLFYLMQTGFLNFPHQMSVEAASEGSDQYMDGKVLRVLVFHVRTQGLFVTTKHVMTVN